MFDRFKHPFNSDVPEVEKVVSESTSRSRWTRFRKTSLFLRYSADGTRQLDFKQPEPGLWQRECYGYGNIGDSHSFSEEAHGPINFNEHLTENSALMKRVVFTASISERKSKKVLHTYMIVVQFNKVLDNWDTNCMREMFKNAVHDQLGGLL